MKTRAKPPAAKPVRKAKPISPKKLQAMIEEAIVDAYDEDEQQTGFETMLDEHLALPFTTVLLGVAVEVRKIEASAAGEIVAMCHRGKDKLCVPILNLPLPIPPPKGAEWIEAYRHWRRHG